MHEYQKILLSCTFAIGDVVMATSAAALLKKIYPHAKISMMVKPLAEQMVINNPVIDEVIAPRYEQKKASFGKMLELLALLKKRKYDLFVSLDGKLRPALVAALAGIPVRVGPASMFGSNTKMPLLITDIVNVGDFRETHYTEALRRLIEYTTGSHEQALPVLPRVTTENQQKAQRLIATLPDYQQLIGLCVKTNPLKTWPLQKFVQLIDKLAQTYPQAVFYIIGEQHDDEYVKKIVAQTQTKVANFAGQTQLMDFVALLKMTDLFITLDTAPMHIASAADVPLVAIFGCTAPKSVAPLSEKAIVLAPTLDCIPCIPNRIAIYPGISKRIAPSSCSHQRCMELVTVEEVFNAVVKQMAKYAE